MAIYIAYFCERFHCDLATFLKRSNDRDERVDVRVAMGYTLNLSASLAFLHSNRVIHRDLKPANILLRLIHQLSSQPAAAGDQWQSVIADFGNSAIVQHQKVAEGGVSCAAKWAATGRALSRRVCTLWYAAPEMLLPHETYCFGADVFFSMGLVLLEIEALSAACPTRPGAPDWEQLRACWRLCQPAAATHGFPARAHRELARRQCSSWARTHNLYVPSDARLRVGRWYGLRFRAFAFRLLEFAPQRRVDAQTLYTNCEQTFLYRVAVPCSWMLDC